MLFLLDSLMVICRISFIQPVSTLLGPLQQETHDRAGKCILLHSTIKRYLIEAYSTAPSDARFAILTRSLTIHPHLFYVKCNDLSLKNTPHQFKSRSHRSCRVKEFLCVYLKFEWHSTCADNQKCLFEHILHVTVAIKCLSSTLRENFDLCYAAMRNQDRTVTLSK